MKKYDSILMPTPAEIDKYAVSDKLNVLHRVISNIQNNLYIVNEQILDDIYELVNTDFYFNTWYSYLYGYKLIIHDLNGQYHGKLVDENDENVLSILDKDWKKIKKDLETRYKFVTKNK